LVAVSQSETEFIVGNAVGSNVTNILLVLGASAAIISNYRIHRDISGLGLPLLLLSAVMVAIFAWTGSLVSLTEGLILLAAYAIYIGHLIVDHRSKSVETAEKKQIRPFIWLIASAAGIYFGAEYTLKSTVNLSSLLGFGDTSILALSAVALGTSLPELVVSLAAARKGALEMAVGNIVGSNIFNSLVVIGLPALLTPLTISTSVLQTGLIYMLVASLLCYLTLIRKQIIRAMGLLLLVIYMAFMASLFGIL
jgi:cation:H+ antiporter